MVIDDDSINNFLMNNMLSEIPFVKNFEIFTSANEALQRLHELKKVGDSFDVIILDLNMPEMDGFEFLEAFEMELFDDFPQMKVVIVTSSNLSRDKAKAANFKSVSSYITKPVTDEVLENIYNSYFK